MQYVLLIHAAESRFATMTREAGEASMQAYGAFTKDLFSTGRAGDCAALEGTPTATSVRVREGHRSVKDGPYAETREQLGGYYTLDAETEEDALAWAAKIPDAQGGTIEVRPVVQMPSRPVEGVVPKLGADTHKEYLLLIYDIEARWAAMSESERNAQYGGYVAFNDATKAAGRFIAGAQLRGAATAKLVQMHGDRRVVRDGPFAETREQLGGYYRVWAKDLDDATALAAQIPGAAAGTIEVRPVMNTSAYV
jgi:hypothetical protein